MDLGAPEAFLECSWVVVVCISAVLAISCKKNTRNVRWILDRKAKTARIYISNSEGEWGGVLLGHLASPDSRLGFNCVVFACISAVLAILCQNNVINVR